MKAGSMETSHELLVSGVSDPTLYASVEVNVCAFRLVVLLTKRAHFEG